MHTIPLILAALLAFACGETKSHSGKILTPAIVDGPGRNAPAQNATARSAGKIVSSDLFDSILKLQSFKTCEDLQAYYSRELHAQQIESLARLERERVRRENEKVSNSADGVGQSGGGGGADAREGPSSDLDPSAATNNQEKQVDEADYTKMNDKELFVVTGAFVRRADRHTLKEKAPIPIGGIANPQIYISEEKLTVVGTSEQEKKCFDSIACMPHTIVRIYQLTEDATVLESEQKFPFRLAESRLLQDKLVLAMKADLPLRDPLAPLKPSRAGNPYSSNSSGQAPPRVLDSPVLQEKTDSVLGVPCERIAVLKDIDSSRELATLAVIDVLGSAPTKYQAIVAPKVEFYITERAAYLHSAQSSRDSMVGLHTQMLGSTGTVLVKLDFVEHDLQFAGAGVVPGSAKDRWSLRHIGDSLAIVTTTSTPLDTESKNHSEIHTHLWVVQEHLQRLERVGSVTNLAPKEDVRAVRFVGNFAYIVTYEKTDPLFTIDLANTSAPRLLSELKTPGFSTYLHPDGDKLIGVGFEAIENKDFSWFQGVQLALFDVKDPTRVTKSFNKSFGKRGSYSEVTWEPKAFRFDPLSRTMVLPLVEFEHSSLKNANARDFADKLVFSGALVMRVEETQIVEVGRVSHSKMIPEKCLSSLSNSRSWWEKHVALDINRSFLLGDKVVTVSRFGAQLHALTDLKKPLHQLSWPAESTDCG